MSKNKLKLYSNGPKIDSDAYGNTVKAIEISLRNKSNKNIGIIGDFGSGKSSAIETYCHKNAWNLNLFRRRKVIKVSLAEFCDISKPSSADLQSNIVQQILYSTHKCWIPNSNYVKRGFKFRTLFLVLLFIIFSLSLFFCVKPDYFDWLNIEFNNYFYFLPVGSGILLIISIILFGNVRNIKAKVENIEFEANLEKNNNPLDMYLDEIVYFFKKTNINLVIFEDIDRCEDCDVIFTKLRMLNNILNNVPRMPFRKRIVFMHAVKEDVFKDYEQKSKYFDILIPVRPVFSQNSAYDHFKNLLPNANEFFTEEYIEKVASKFIYMRQLNNVVNAFNILILTYEEKLHTLSYEKLFTVLLYKSLFPDDYILAIKGTGILCYLRSQKEDFKTKKFDDYPASKIFKNLSEQEKSSNSEYNKHLKAFNDLKSFYADFSGYLGKDAFNLISVFPDDGYSKHDKLFVNSLEDNLNQDNVEEKFNDPVRVLSESKILKNIGSESCCNLDLFLELFKTDIYIKEQEIFKSGFKNLTPIREKFILKMIDDCYREQENSERRNKEISFLFDISLFINLFSLISNDKNKAKTITRINILCLLLSSSNIKIQNDGNCFVKFLNDSNYSLSFLTLIKDEVLDSLIVDKLIKLKVLRYGKNDNERLISMIIPSIIDNLLFEINAENLLFVAKTKNTSNFNKSVFTTIKMNHQNFYSKLISWFINNKKDPFDFTDNFSNESEETINEILELGLYSDGSIAKFLKSCPLLKECKTNNFDGKILIKFLKANKICFTFNDIGENWNSFDADLKNELIGGIIENRNNIKMIDLSEMGLVVFSETLNDKRCINDISGVILEKTIKPRQLDVKLINKESESFRVALSCGYFCLTNDLLLLLDQDSKLIEPFQHGEYFTELIESNNIYNISLDLARAILISIQNNEQRINFMKMYKSIFFNSKNNFSELVNETNILSYPEECVREFLNSVNLFENEKQDFALKFYKFLTIEKVEDDLEVYMKECNKFKIPTSDFAKMIKNLLKKSKKFKVCLTNKNLTITKINQ